MNDINEKISQDETNEEFPGYPHYPAKDDILNPANNTERVEVDMENITRSPNTVRLQEKEDVKQVSKETSVPFASTTSGNDEDDELQIVDGTDADVTEDDLLILESDGGDIVAKEEDLVATDTMGGPGLNDLDLAGTELDDANEEIGEEDEENNYYSLGGDEKDGLETEHE